MSSHPAPLLSRLFALTLVSCGLLGCDLLNQKELTQLEAIQARLDNELISKQTLANNLNEFKRQRELAQARWSAALPIQVGQSLADSLQGKIPRDVQVRAADDSVQLSASGGGQGARLVVRELAKVAPALVLRRLEVRADGTWTARIERPVEAVAAPNPPTPPSIRDDELPQMKWYSGGGEERMLVRIKQTRAEVAQLDKVMEMVRQIVTETRTLDENLKQAQQGDRVGTAAAAIAAIYASDSPQLSQGTWEADGSGVTVRGAGPGLSPSSVKGYTVTTIPGGWQLVVAPPTPTSQPSSH